MMTCAEFSAGLDRYARGAMPPAEAAALEAHAGSCADCARLLEQLEPALPAAAGLSKVAQPAEDLWPRIAVRIERARVAPGIRLSWRALAAAAVLVVAASSGVTMLLLRQGRPVVVAPPARVLTFEAEYAEAAQDLTVALDRARQRLSPEAVTAIERNLAVIDSALAEVRRALDRDPGNVVLEQLVTATWQQKMDLLRRATALGGAS